MVKFYFLRAALIASLATFGLEANSQTNLLQADFAGITAGNSTSSTGSSTPWAGDSLFSTVSSAYQAGGAVRLGTSSSVGSITSIPLDLSVNGGVFKVKVKVKGWSAAGGSISITAGSLGVQALSYSATMSNPFEEVEASFTGGTANSTITIATPSASKRAFIDEVTVYYGGTDLSNDASLSDLQVNGSTVAGFSGSTINYYVSLASSTNQVPVITATTTHANATASVVAATSYVNDTAYVNVTAENGSTTKQYTIYISKEAADGEKGSKSNPYTVAEARSLLYPTGTSTKYWVEGYVVGSISSSGTPFSIATTDVDTNLGIADAANETNVAAITPVELPTGSVRTALGLSTTPSNKGALIQVYGNLINYFGVSGVKNTTEYVIVSLSGLTAGEQGNPVRVRAGAGKLVVDGADPGIRILVYSASGSLIHTLVASETSTSQNLPQGFYIVKVGAASFKVIVR